MAATFVLSSVPLAQEIDGSALDEVTRVVARYLACRLNVDLPCIIELTDQRFYEEVGITSNELGRQTRNVARTRNAQYASSTFDVAQASEPFVSGDRLVSFVPYFESVMDEPEGRRYDQLGFLLASSYDNSESWQLVKIEGVHRPMLEYIEREFPGFAGRPMPPVLEQVVQEPWLERTRSVATAARRFVMVDGGFVYAMKWVVRKEIDSKLSLAIRYDNPADSSRPLSFRGSLEPGQQVLEWQSVVLTDFEVDRTYDVVVEVSEPDTGELLFEHRQSLLFKPTREIWLSMMSQPPVSTADVAP